VDRGETQTVDAVAWPNGVRAALYRPGGLAGLCSVSATSSSRLSYLIAGDVPGDGQGEAWHAYLDGRTGLWWGIASLSVVTDLLVLPIVAALHVALGRIKGSATLAGSGLLVLFVILDLAVTWPNYAALITLAGEAADAKDAGRAAAIGGGDVCRHGARLEPVRGVRHPHPGCGDHAHRLRHAARRLRPCRLLARRRHRRLRACGGLGGLVVAALGTLAILTSVLAAAWVVIVGFRLLILGRARSGG
jgi:hypothetical protein